MIPDFTHRRYAELIRALQGRGYGFLTFRELAAGHLASPHALLRHDVDRLPGRALALARLEHGLGVKSTYFFRVKPVSFHPGVMRAIAGMGHEIGYHYEELADCAGDRELAWARFKENLARFQVVGGVKSLAMHGRPFCAHDCRDLWDSHDYRDCGVALEAYRDLDWSRYYYFTDVGRCWNSKANLRDHAPGARNAGLARPPRSTPELAALLPRLEGDLVISTHPERWCASAPGWLQVLAWDFAVRQAKRLLARSPSG